MKIHPTQRTPQTGPVERDGRRRAQPGNQRAGSPVPAARVERSAFATARSGAEPSPVRKDVVAEVRQALADGTFEASVDLDTVLDSLLADL